MVDIHPFSQPAETVVPATMRAAVLLAPGDIRVVDRPVPAIGPDEVLVRVRMCGLCGTDLKILDGHFPRTPPFGTFTPGHEWTGVVAAVGAAVDEFAPGDQVCIEAHRGCGRCANCLVGKYTACLNFGDTTKGHRATGMTTDGGFAEYAVHHVSALHRLPAPLTPEDGVLITTAGTALWGLAVAGAFVIGQRVAVFGPGPVGLMTVQVCRLLGAASVFLVGTRASRLALGRSLGADQVLDVREVDPVGRLRDLTDGLGVDLAIECSGAPEAAQQCAEVTRPGGAVLALAFYPDRVSLDLSALVRNNITLFTGRGEGGDVVRRAVALAARGQLRCGELVTHRFPLAEIGEAFRVLRAREGDPVKVVVVP